MKSLHPNIYIDTWIKGTLVFVVSHLVILLGIALWQKSFQPLNVFYILDLHLIFPHLVQGFWYDVLSLLIVCGVFGFFYTNRKK